MSRFLPQKSLSFSETLLLPEVFFNLFICRLKVSYQPSVKYMPKVTAKSTKNISPTTMVIAIRVAKVVNGLSTRTPWKSTCLVNALAAHSMLRKRKIEHKIHIGVAPALQNQFIAHAWLSVADIVIVGDGNLENFREIARLS
jgi:hypothetical protein